MQVSSGCAATLAIVLGQKLFVANVGDCPAFLSYRSADGGAAVTSLSISHSLQNEDERLRLLHLGYTEPASAESGLGPHGYTRCLGNYPVKGGYKEIPQLAVCSDDPVTAEPEITGPITISEDLELLVITTASLLAALERCGAREPRRELAALLLRHLEEEPGSSVASVAQCTVDHVVRMYTEREEVDTTSLIQV